VGDAFTHDRTRVVSWVDPERVRRLMDGLTGLEVNEAIRDGRLPEPTLSRVLGIRCVAVSDGEVSAELMPREDLENLGGTIHGGVLAALLDRDGGRAPYTPVRQPEVRHD
jgi:acyl-coenzyme A thioesterase PaaI-like protein